MPEVIGLVAPQVAGGEREESLVVVVARDERPWAGPDPPGVVFFYAPGRGGRHAECFLEGFNGILQVDGYAGYNAVAAPGKGVTRAYCWVYVAQQIMLRSSWIPCCRAGGALLCAT